MILLLGCTLRLWAPGRMAVEHFDEGVYASNLWFGADAGYQYPNRPLYAPPLVPILIECSLLAFGPEGVAPMLPNLLAGCATGAIVWWTARSWFGPVAGTAAMALAATSEIHILYSRTALTDVLLCFWWLASAIVAERAFRGNRYELALAAGVLAGLAWWTKYNGWLTIGVATGGAALWLLAQRPARSQASRTMLAAVILAAAAIAVWSPVLIGLQSFPGGYSAVAANHAKYFVGFSGWLASARTQLITLSHLDGPWTLAGAAIACFTAATADRWRPALTPVEAFGPSITAHALFGGPGAWMLLVWFAGLTFATPLYHPYPRLALPWIVAVWLVSGAALGRLTDRSGIRRSLLAAGAVALLAAGGAWIADERNDFASSAWQPHNDLRSVAENIIRDTAPNTDSRQPPVIFVYGEPALLYHLNAVQFEREPRVVVIAAGNLVFGEIPSGHEVFLAAGLHAHQTAEFPTAVNKTLSRFVLRKGYPYLASDLVLSDHFHPAAWGEKRRQMVKLYRVK